jgi:hypothetical protein
MFSKGDQNRFLEAKESRLSSTEIFVSLRCTLCYFSLRGRILQWQADYERVASVILLDGLHAGYVPDGRVLYEGGRIDASGLAPFIKLAGESSMKPSAKRFLITHSEIFQGTFVSTTEATDFILKELSVKRHPVLRWGPGGMQQLSFARKSHFEVIGFAGNTAPDHVDHFHGLAYFLKELRKL